MTLNLLPPGSQLHNGAISPVDGQRSAKLTLEPDPGPAPGPVPASSVSSHLRHVHPVGGHSPAVDGWVDGSLLARSRVSRSCLACNGSGPRPGGSPRGARPPPIPHLHSSRLCCVQPHPHRGPRLPRCAPPVRTLVPRRPHGNTKNCGRRHQAPATSRSPVVHGPRRGDRDPRRAPVHWCARPPSPRPDLAVRSTVVCVLGQWSSSDHRESTSPRWRCKTTFLLSDGAVAPPKKTRRAAVRAGTDEACGSAIRRGRAIGCGVRIWTCARTLAGPSSRAPSARRLREGARSPAINQPSPAPRAGGLGAVAAAWLSVAPVRQLPPSQGSRRPALRGAVAPACRGRSATADWRGSRRLGPPVSGATTLWIGDRVAAVTTPRVL